MKSALALAAGLCGLALLPGCANTSGEYTALSLDVVGGPLAFDTAAGWSVKLEQAAVALGPLYLYGEEERSGVLAAVWRAMAPISTARAHVVVAGGPVLGEVLVQIAISLQGPPAALEGHTGLAGRCATAELAFYSPKSVAFEGPASVWSFLEDSVVRVKGSAAPIGEPNNPIDFDLWLAADAVSSGIPNIPADILLSAPLARVKLQVDAQQWLQSVDFSSGQAGEDGVARFAAGTQGWLAFRHGVLSRSAYSLAPGSPSTLAGGNSP